MSLSPHLHLPLHILLTTPVGLCDFSGEVAWTIIPKVSEPKSAMSLRPWLLPLSIYH